MEFVAKGYTGNLKVTPTKVILERTGLFRSRGNVEIPIKNITAIRFREATMVRSGFIEFTFSGGQEGSSRFGAAANNENALVFTRQQERDFIKAKKMIEQYKAELEAAPTKEQTISASLADQIRELAKLRDEGVISNDEFETAKKKLLGI